MRKSGYAVNGLEGVMRLLATGLFPQLINPLPALAGAFLFINELLLLLITISPW